MSQGEFTRQEAKSVEEAVLEMYKALSRPKQAEYIGHLNDILLFIAAAMRAAPDENDKRKPRSAK